MTRQKLADHADDGFAIGRGYLNLHRHGEPGSRYWLGRYVDACGIATVYRQDGLVRIDFACDGRLYQRSWQRGWPDRTISRLAKAFISEIVERCANG